MWDRKDAKYPFQNPTEPSMESRTFAAPAEGFVNVGATVFIKGEIQGAEDLVVEGEVEGQINLKDHNLHLGPKSRVRAQIYAKTVTIEGDVRGDVFASERLVIKKTGRLNGNIVAPRLVLEDGARFKGTIDMDKTVEPPKVAGRDVPTLSAVPPVEPRDRLADSELG